jgi:hypothetical protein
MPDPSSFPVHSKGAVADQSVEAAEGGAKPGALPPSKSFAGRLLQSASKAALYGTSVDVHQVCVRVSPNA